MREGLSCDLWNIMTSWKIKEEKRGLYKRKYSKEACRTTGWIWQVIQSSKPVVAKGCVAS